MRMNVIEIAAVKQQAAKVGMEISIFEDQLSDLYYLDTCVFYNLQDRRNAEKYFKRKIARARAKRKLILAELN